MASDVKALAPLARAQISLNVVVRFCTASDVPNLEWFGTFSHHREILAQAFARHERGENLMLVADACGFPVGQAWVDLEKRRAANVAYIWAVRVLPPLQNAGVGTLLMRAAHRVLAERGFREAEVGVEKDNPGARRLYERLGYACIGELVEDYGYTTPDGRQVRHTVDQWLLRKPLIAAEGERR